MISKPPWKKEAIGNRVSARLLGNPLAFSVVQLLAENRELSVGEIARAVHRSVQRVSTVLGVLRVAEVGALPAGRQAESVPAQTSGRGQRRSQRAFPLYEAASAVRGRDWQ
jgi:hypothetical protein